MPTSPITVHEPVLPMDDIQGIATPGFLKPHQTLVGVICDGSVTAVQSFKRVIGELAAEVATARQTLDDRRSFRAQKTARGAKKRGTALLAVGFTYQGLLKLTPGAQAIPGDAFRQGLAARSALLGDPADPRAEGNAGNWTVGGPGKELDALFVVAGDDRPVVAKRVSDLLALLKRAKIEVVYNEDGGVRDDMPGHEHFGFDDGVSQPGIRGRASDAADDFVTDRHIDATCEPAHSLFGYPGQDLVWPGVLLLGHPATSPDPLVPGLPSQAVPEWSRNGSFLVFRRLRQDVGLFWRTMRDEAERLHGLPGYETMTDDLLASRIVGRWPSGAPVNRVPAADDPRLGGDPEANNNFRFDSDAVPLPLASGNQDQFPQSKADPAGITCPWAAHIRKVNTRDSGSDMGGRDSTYARRLLRVGVPFGKPLENRYATKKDDPQRGQRGLLFLSIQASIEEQFEFLSSRWMNDPARPKTPGGHDLFVGQNPADGAERLRRCVLFGSGMQQATVATDAQWIVPTGGGYFFVPSLSSLADVLAR
jgi:Dyp-type peroxidase family